MKPVIYNCPHTVRKRNIHFLMCKKQMKDGMVYNDEKTAITAICGYQFECRNTHQMEHTRQAMFCKFR